MNTKLTKEISKYSACILYTPLRSEVDYTKSAFPIKIKQKVFFVPNKKDTKPFDVADEFSENLKGKKVFLLIPGTKFDKYGTRYGRGGGWYDRFLSKIPKEWIRIGVAEATAFSKSKLKRKKWDQPVDWIIIKHHNYSEILKSLEKRKITTIEPKNRK